MTGSNASFSSRDHQPQTSAKTLLRAVVPRSLRNWLRSPAKSTQWLHANLKYAFGAVSNVEIRPGWSVICHPATYDMSYKYSVTDPDQAAELDGFIANCHMGMVLFDIGAHFGLFSLAALHYGGPDARVVAVDPSPTAVSMTKVQAKLNNVSSSLAAIQAACTDRTGTLDLISAGPIADGYFMLPTDHGTRELTSVRAVTIDSLVQETGLVPTHIKIDVEGHEQAVIVGGAMFLKTHSVELYLELHNQIIREAGGCPENVLKLLRRLDYVAFSVGGLPIDDASILKSPVMRLVATRQ
jgi:FkbM family methyltransferase